MRRLTEGPCPRCFRNGGPLPVSPRYDDCTYPIRFGSSTIAPALVSLPPFAPLVAQVREAGFTCVCLLFVHRESCGLY
jgi:hypothetical protein